MNKLYVFVIAGCATFRTLHSFQHIGLAGNDLISNVRSDHHASHNMRTIQLASYREESGFDSYGDEQENKDYLKSLLTFQSIKTFMYYCNEFRDEVTTQWITKFDEVMKEKEEAEGKITWDEYMETMMRTEPEEISIKKRSAARRGIRGLNYLEKVIDGSQSSEEEESTENPYLTEQEYEFKILIEPFSLVKRILSVREQISKEWSEDLKLIRLSNDELIRFHYDRTILGEAEAMKGQMLVYEGASFGVNTPYRTESYKLLTEMVTKVAMRRCENDIKTSNNKQAEAWFDLIQSQTAKLQPNDLMKHILSGGEANEAEISADEKLERAVSGERMARVIMSLREHCAEESLMFLQETKEDHNKLLTAFLNERLQDEMSMVDLLEYNFRMSSSEDEMQENQMGEAEET